MNARHLLRIRVGGSPFHFILHENWRDHFTHVAGDFTTRNWVSTLRAAA